MLASAASRLPAGPLSDSVICQVPGVPKLPLIAAPNVRPSPVTNDSRLKGAASISRALAAGASVDIVDKMQT